MSKSIVLFTLLKRRTSNLFISAVITILQPWLPIAQNMIIDFYCACSSEFYIYIYYIPIMMFDLPLNAENMLRFRTSIAAPYACIPMLSLDTPLIINRDMRQVALSYPTHKKQQSLDTSKTAERERKKKYYYYVWIFHLWINFHGGLIFHARGSSSLWVALCRPSYILWYQMISVPDAKISVPLALATSSARRRTMNILISVFLRLRQSSSASLTV